MERINREMISKLIYALEEIDLGELSIDYHDAIEMIHRNAGRLVLLASSFDRLPYDLIEQWFDEATEVYAIITQPGDYEL